MTDSNPDPDYKKSAGHECLTAGAMTYIADYGPPGIGQSWECTACGTGWARVGADFYPPEWGVHILRPEDVI